MMSYRTERDFHPSVESRGFLSGDGAWEQGGWGMGCLGAWGLRGGSGLVGAGAWGDGMDVFPDILADRWKKISILFFGSPAKMEIL